jgi:hypothetical protein
MRRLFLLAMLALPLSALHGCSLYGCGDEVTRQAASPDGRVMAAAFVRNCGATTGFTTHVAVFGLGQEPEERHRVFIAQAGTAPESPHGGAEVELRWLAPDRLLVSYDPRAEVFFQAVRSGGMTIEYRTVGRRVRRDRVPAASPFAAFALPHDVII